jgi:hypothetical protein
MRLSVIIVMQTSQDWARDDQSTPRCLGSLRQLAGDPLINTLVGSRVIEVPLVFLHQPAQMTLAQDQEVVQALPLHAAQESFADRVCLRRSERCPQDLNPCS